jgi:predicted glutamine amidotransferase
MCKLFGAVTLPELVPEEMLNFRHYATVDRDGWGIAWYDSGRLRMVKSRESALKNHKYVATADRINSRIVLAHLRRMTRGNVREVNAHPFRFNNYVFAHNGTVDISGLAHHLKGSYKRIRGDTDSELLFRFLVQNMEKWGHFMGLRKAVKEINSLAKECPVTSLNFIMADGRYLYAFKRVYRGANNLYYKQGDGFYKSFVVSSKPQNGGWAEMENGEFIAVDSNDMSVIRTMVL